MNSERWERIKEIFDSAADLPGSERAAVLSRCTDADVRAEVERLLKRYDQAGDFLEEPVIERAPQLAEGVVVAGRYEIVRLLGRGGMGEVFEASDRMLGETVALKTLLPELAGNRAMLERFQKEILTARKVTHPNVCRVFEVGVHEGLHYFTMEVLSGETLTSRISRAGRMRSAEAIPVIRQMAAGLQAAHEAGIVHRDFKSANVMLAGDRAVITDFGLARQERAAAAGSGSTAPTIGVRAGTLGYMSPEQLSGGPVTAASDIYSFGIVMFEMAAARLPFDSVHVINSAVQRATGQVPWIRREVPDIDKKWESAIERCLQPDPAKRFGSAREIAEHFDGWRLPVLPAPSRRWWLAAGGAAGIAGAAALWPRTYIPDAAAAIWYSRGVEALLATTYEQARRLLEKAVSLDPRYAPARAYLAAAMLELDDQQGAKGEMLEALGSARAIRLAEADELRLGAVERVFARDFDAAAPLANRLVQIASNNHEKANAYLHKAWIDSKRRDFDSTRRSIEEALRLDPFNAGAVLWMALLDDQRQEHDKAEKRFAEAEALFRAATDMDGVAEVYWRRARSLARRKRGLEAIDVSAKGLAIATGTANVYHQVRFRLTQALAYRGMGDPERSRQIAAEAVRIATGRGMDAVAAVGLIDLGQAHLLLDEPRIAEPYLLQGLEMARRGHAAFSEARAGLQLASLCVQYDRPAEALPYVERALPFFRDGGFQREAMQGLLLLGGANTRLSRFEDAGKVIVDAVARADAMGDREQQGLARGFQATLFQLTGRLPEAAAAVGKALELFGDLQRGYRAAHALASRALIFVELGSFKEARADIAEASKWATRSPGKQVQVAARIELAESGIAYINGQWAAAARHARAAHALKGGDDESRQAMLLLGMSEVRSGGSVAAVRAAIAAFDRADDRYWSAYGRLLLSEATGSRTDASEALNFFEQNRIWTGVWRSHRALGAGLEHGPAMKAAVSEIRRSWPEMYASTYFDRPDFKKFGPL